MFKNVFSFNGRIRRTEYGISAIIYTIALLIIDVLILQLNSGAFLALFYIPLIWFMLAQGTKRCHDRGNHGIWQLIPFYGLWMLFADGEPFTNNYGDDPKGRGRLIEELLSDQPH